MIHQDLVIWLATVYELGSVRFIEMINVELPIKVALKFPYL